MVESITVTTFYKSDKSKFTYICILFTCASIFLYPLKKFYFFPCKRKFSGRISDNLKNYDFPQKSIYRISKLFVGISYQTICHLWFRYPFFALGKKEETVISNLIIFFFFCCRPSPIPFYSSELFFLSTLLLLQWRLCCQQEPFGFATALISCLCSRPGPATKCRASPHISTPLKWVIPDLLSSSGIKTSNPSDRELKALFGKHIETTPYEIQKFGLKQKFCISVENSWLFPRDFYLLHYYWHVHTHYWHYYSDRLLFLLTGQIFIWFLISIDKFSLFREKTLGGKIACNEHTCD